MELTSRSKNQHFLPQIEQRLNAIDPNVSRKLQRIYSFSIRDREKFLIQLDAAKGKRIENNLSLNDLFSFDVVDKSIRHNFETLFGQYECEIEENTRSLLKKLAQGSLDVDVKAEILDIFAIKFLNFIRNPYSIKKVLNSIATINQYHPVDTVFCELYTKILNGKKPQQKFLCTQMGISEDEYNNWLRALFMLLMRPIDTNPNMLEYTIKALYECSSYLMTVVVCHYTDDHADKRCLLSDRGYSTPSATDTHLAFDFNLNSNAFIVYVFTDVQKAAKEGTPSKIIELYKRAPREVKVCYKKNDLEALSKYNRRVVYQCHRNVYSSTKNVYGL